MLEIGQKAPEFRLPTDNGGEFILTNNLGKNVIVYFYPKDDTSGCTNEALQFSAKIDEFMQKDAVIIGISKDNVKSHDKFKLKYDLKVILGSDENLDVANQYGVWVEKSMYGKKYMGMDRATFLINKEGSITKIWRKVKIPGHIEEVLSEVSKL